MRMDGWLGEGSVDFLDVTLFWSAGRLEYRPFIKPTSQKIPLSPNSWHAPSVHGSWPIAEILRLRKRCSNGQEFKRAKDNMLLYFSRGGLQTSTLEACAQIPFIRPLQPYLDAMRNDDAIARDALVGWPVKFHPLWCASGTRRILRQSQHEWQSTLVQKGMTSTIKICWRNGGPHLKQRLLVQMATTIDE